MHQHYSYLTAYIYIKYIENTKRISEIPPHLILSSKKNITDYDLCAKTFNLINIPVSVNKNTILLYSGLYGRSVVLNFNTLYDCIKKAAPKCTYYYVMWMRSYLTLHYQPLFFLWSTEYNPECQKE